MNDIVEIYFDETEGLFYLERWNSDWLRYETSSLFYDSEDEAISALKADNVKWDEV